MGGPPTGLSRRTEDLPARPSRDRHEAGPARPGERNTSFHPELPRTARSTHAALLFQQYGLSRATSCASRPRSKGRHPNQYQHRW